MAGFCIIAVSLQTPILGLRSVKRRKSPADIWKAPIFGKLRPETGFDPHCLARGQRERLSSLTHHA